MTPKANPPPDRPPLWPKPIPVIGLTGDYASGKTLFGLTIAPGKDTLVYDCEKSSASYSDLGHHRIDVPSIMLARTAGESYTSEQLFVWWRDHVREIPAGQYRVIMLDPASEIEAGIYDFVNNHPQLFGKTRQQYAKSTAMVWGDVKDYWKRILADVASRCETFVFTVHLKSVWVDNKPTNKKAPKGKSTLEELASLYLWMERKPNLRGEVPAQPAAIVKKTRLLHTRFDPATGTLEMIPALPPRLPIATPAAIRAYQTTPPDPARLKPEEMAPEERMTTAEELELRARIAADEAETERLRASRATPLASAPAKVDNGGLAALANPLPPDPPIEEPPPPALPCKCSEEILGEIASARRELFDLVRPDDEAGAWAAILAKRGVQSARDLDEAQAKGLLHALDRKLAEVRLSMQADAVGEARPAGAPF